MDFTSEGKNLLINQLYSIWHWGFLATGVFFFLSGFGLYYSIQRNSPLEYSWFFRQIKKMVLPFLFLWIVYLICYVIWEPVNIKWTLLSDFFTLSSPGRETWFFKVIVGTYFITFFIFKYVSEKLRLPVLVGCTIIYAFVMAKYSTGPWWYNSVFNFPLGMLVAKYYNKVDRIHDYIVIPLSIIAYFLFYRYLRIDILESMAFAFLIIWLCKYIDIRSRYLYFVGVYSLSFYFLEMPSKQFICISFINNYWLFTISAIVMTSLIVLLYSYFQRTTIYKRLF